MIEVGHRFPARTFRVDPGRVEEFVRATGVDPEPGYAPLVGAPVPPGFLMYVAAYGAELIHEALELDYQRAVYGGATFEYLAPIVIGDELSVEVEIVGNRTKTGNSGRLTFFEVSCEYLLEGEVAVRERSTVIQRG